MAEESGEDRYAPAYDAHNNLDVSERRKGKFEAIQMIICKYDIIRRASRWRESTYAQIPCEPVVYVKSLE